MTEVMRGLRADLRLALRPACVLVLAGVLVTCGLASAVMQDVQFEQLKAARVQVQQGAAAHPCTTGTRACLRDRAVEQRENHAHLQQQQADSAHVASLQTLVGALAYAASFMGLGTGAAVIAVLATLTVAGEWRRKTMALALAGGVSPRALALRRLTALVCLSLAAFAAAGAGSIVAAIWGASRRPLGEVHYGAIEPLVGGCAVMLAYAATASAVAWYARDALRTASFTVALLAAVAVTTSFGTFMPGSVIASALDLHRVLEFEIGYVWMWPQLSFSPSGGAASHVVEGPGWVPAILLVAAITVAAIGALLVRVRRSDPFG